MSMPIETVAEAFEAAWDDAVRTHDPDVALDEAETTAFVQGVVGTTLASLTRHREGVARALHADDLAHGNTAAEWEDMDLDAILWYRRNADAVLAYLTGEQP